MAEINPIRYRGYYFDQETGLYYLQSRYYDPEVGRFINADGLASTGQGILGCNMFAYCGNCLPMYCDPGGMLRAVPVRIDDFYGIAPLPELLVQKEKYHSMDEAAIAGGRVAARYSRINSCEYAFGIDFDGQDYVLSEMQEGTFNSINMLPLIRDHTVGIVHSHPNIEGFDSNSLSLFRHENKYYGDKGVALNYEIAIYLAAPNGSLLRCLATRKPVSGLPEFSVIIICSDMPIDNTPTALY